jgi:2,4-dienoyl-CoA reductase-like NADH-dependent reductase (Old Yellow Enzyme family)
MGLIIVGLMGITPLDEPITKKYFSLSEDRLLPTHYNLTEAVHIEGARIGIQLCHVVSQVHLTDFGGKATLSPSGVQQFDLNQKPLAQPRPMTRSEVYQMIEFFPKASLRAKRAGYDLVEIHAAHGYLLHSFLFQATNKRADEFGGSLENRARIVTEIIKEAHKLTGSDYPIGVRINTEDRIHGGITLEDSKVIVKVLEDAGAAFINVGIGTYASQIKLTDVMQAEEGSKLPLWEAIKKAVTIPVIAAGGIRHPNFCEKIISEGSADFVWIGATTFFRPLLA